VQVPERKEGRRKKSVGGREFIRMSNAQEIEVESCWQMKS
jgi:hypothetical protein